MPEEDGCRMCRTANSHRINRQAHRDCESSGVFSWPPHGQRGHEHFVVRQRRNVISVDGTSGPSYAASVRQGNERHDIPVQAVCVACRNLTSHGVSWSYPMPGLSGQGNAAPRRRGRLPAGRHPGRKSPHRRGRWGVCRHQHPLARPSPRRFGRSAARAILRHGATLTEPWGVVRPRMARLVTDPGAPACGSCLPRNPRCRWSQKGGSSGP